MGLDLWGAVADERRRLADELDALTDEQWEMQSQCDAWSVRQVAAHLITPFEVSNRAFFLALLRNRFSFDRAMVEVTDALAARLTNEEIVRVLREHADDRWTPPTPGAGVEAVLAEVLVHAQDIRNVVGLPCSTPDEIVEAALGSITKERTAADYRRRVAG